MCYSAEVSFVTWGFGMMCAAILASSGQPVTSFLFPLVVTQMQLIEGLRWINALPDDILALLGKLTIYLQPLAAMVEGGVATKWMALYAVSQALTELLFGSRDLRFVVAGDGHFRWKWIESVGGIAMVPYWIALALAAYVVLPLPVYAAMVGLLVYYNVKHWDYVTVGSLWCVSVNILWIYYLLR
jgi:hypothetical protein